MQKLKFPHLISGIVGVIMLLAAIVYVSPIFFVVINASKYGKDLLKPFLSLPSQWRMTNYSDAFKSLNLGRGFFNSAIITFFSVFLIIIFASMASYAIARWENKFTNMLYVSFVMGMVIPFSVIMVPSLKILSFFKLSGKVGLIAMYVALGMSLAIFLITGFVKSSIPKELEEAMYVDGASTLTIFFKLVLPLLRPIIITMVLLDTVWVWNDFLLPTILLTSPDTFTLPVSLYNMTSEHFQRWNLLFAAAIFAMLPIIILFFSCQKYIVKGITEGSLKG